MTVVLSKPPNDLASNSTTKSPIHLGYLDGLRALAALFVMMHHAWLTVWQTDANHMPHGLIRLMTGWLRYGHFSVDVFIVLSGFCLMLPVVRGDGTIRGGALNFFKKRARRILPPYYLALAFSLVLVLTVIGNKTGTHWDCCIPATKRGLLIDLLMLQDILGTTINHAFWSVSVEWRIYFLFPLIIWGWNRWGGIQTTLAVVAAPYAAYLLLKHSPHLNLLGTCPWFLGLFALGMLGSAVAFSKQSLWSSWREKMPWKLISLCLTVGIAAACSHWGWVWIEQHYQWADLFVGLLTICVLIIAAVSEENILHKVFSWRPFVFIGTFAYSLYLIHAPLLQVIWQYALHPMHLSRLATFLLLTLVGIPLIVGFAYLFFLVCERPFLTSRKRETQAETARDAALLPAP